MWESDMSRIVYLLTLKKKTLIQIAAADSLFIYFILLFFFCIFQEKGLHFMCVADYSYDMSNLVFFEKNNKGKQK